MIHLPGYVIDQLLRDTVHSHVYRAISKADKRSVVIKLARESSSEVHAAAQQELEIIRKLDGLVCVRAIELTYFEDRPALVMELFPGIGVDEWLAGQPLALDRFLRIAVAVAGALAGVHERGVIHRDLKPSNILINPETLEVCIADFGVAASLDGALSLQVAAMVGSLAYLSPEQTGRMNRRVDSRSDLYSLGVAFYEMVTARLPFERTSPLDLVHAHLALTPRSPSERNPEIPAVVSELIGKLLAKSPDDRYQSARGALADLQALAEQHRADQPLGGFALGRHDRARTFLLPSKLYGRQAELAVLERSLAAAQAGAVEVLLVGGASGAGKTALFAEAEHRLAVRHGYFIKGKFDRLARNVPFSAVSQAIAGLVEQLLAKTDCELDDVRAELLHRLSGLGQVVIEVAAAVEQVIGPQPALPALGLAEAQARINDGFWRLLSAIATRDRPVVMVLDDLQWADSGSLALVEAVIEQARHGRDKVALLVLGAYRENEVTAGHPLRALLDRVGQASPPVHASLPGQATDAGPAVQTLALAPLEVSHVAELLSDTLCTPIAQLAGLADTVFRKTGGNAFFIHQFLNHAHRRGLFRFSASDGWQWELEAIQTADIPDDAAGLMADKIRSLPAGIQSVVVDASIIGDAFDLKALLAVTAVPAEDALRAVHGLIEHGLVIRAGEHYRFSHDRIREAALGLCSDDRASQLHVAVGRHQLRSLAPAARSGAQIFAITDHLNHGRRHLLDSERVEVAALNLLSGKQALAVGAVPTAQPYFVAGLALLDGIDPWRTQFQLVFELTLEHAHTQFFLGDTEPALAAFHALLDRALSLPNLTAVYLRLITARVAHQDYAAACREGIAALAAFGIRIPRRVARWHQLVAIAAAMWKVGREPERLLELPESTDEIARARNQLINALGVPFYFHDVAMSSLLILKVVPKLFEDGPDASSPMQLNAYAVILQVMLHKPALARRFAKVASELHRRLGSPRDAADLLFRQYQMLEPWHVPYRDSLAAFELAIEKASDVGDHQNMVYCHVCRIYCGLIEGIHLTRVERMGQDAIDACVRIGIGAEVGVVVSLREVAGQLRDQPVLDLPDDWFHTPLLGRLVRSTISFHLVATAQLLVLILRGDYSAGYRLADQICPAIFREAAGVVFVWIACVGLGIGAAIGIASARGRARRRYRRQLDGAIAQLRDWAVHNPGFFGHKVLWLEAERALARGRHEAAMALYTQAREAALAAQYPHLAAAIDLRRGELALAIGLPSEAVARFEAAIEAYRSWGARALASHLEQRFAALGLERHPWADAALAKAGPADSLGTTGRIAVQPLEFGALVSASQAIAQEVTLASVLDRVMSNTMATAGATLGVILLEQRGALAVELRQRAGEPLERIATPVELVADLPRSVIQYVHRSGETVVLEDAANRGRFTADPWIRASAAKSILCAPIVKQSRRVGVLLLCNELVSSAFTDRHLATLQMLATQAAISIDNAILYDELSTLNRELEARVDDRTRALRAAQQQLIESARRAGMADVAVEVLHNVGNALNSVNISAQLIHAQLTESKRKTLHRVVDLLGEHKHDLAEFLTSDTRGQKIAPMLALLDSALAGEHDAMIQELAQLRDNIDNAGAVVRELEATAADKGIAMLEPPELVIREAAAQIRERLERDQVALEIECHAAPGTKVDRHKALDILTGLLRNALDALAPPGTAAAQPKQIWISARDDAGRVVFDVRDNGIGIAAEDLTRIFHAGFGSTPDRRGASLHRFANAASSLGGSLTADSAGPGRGARFTLMLPDRGAAHDPPGRRRSAPTSQPPPGLPPTSPPAGDGAPPRGSSA